VEFCEVTRYVLFSKSPIDRGKGRVREGRIKREIIDFFLNHTPNNFESKKATAGHAAGLVESLVEILV
jgi:hypothetical protein